MQIKKIIIFVGSIFLNSKGFCGEMFELEISDSSGKNSYTEVSRDDIKNGKIFLRLIGNDIAQVSEATFRFTRNEPSTKKTPFVQKHTSKNFDLNLDSVLGEDTTTFHYLVEFQLKLPNKITDWSPKFPIVVIGSKNSKIEKSDRQITQGSEINDAQVNFEFGSSQGSEKKVTLQDYQGDPLTKNQLEAFHRKAIQEIDSEKWMESLDTLSKLIAASPQVEFYLLRSKVLAHLNKDNVALSDLDQALKLNNEHLEVRYQRAILRKKNFDEIGSEQDLDFILKQDKGHLNALLQKAALVLDKGDSRAAINLLNTALDYKKDWAIAYALRAAAFVKLMLNSKALEDYNLALKFNPNYPEVYYNRGLAYLKQNEGELACSDFSMALKNGLHTSQNLIDKYCPEE